MSLHLCYFFFFFNDTATTEIYTLSLHDALPISEGDAVDSIIGTSGTTAACDAVWQLKSTNAGEALLTVKGREYERSEEHTSELQSPCNLVCRLLLEKKKHRRAAGIPRRRCWAEP